MSTQSAAGRLPSNRRFVDRFGDRALVGTTIVASVAVVVILALIVEHVVNGSTDAISRFGIGFLWHTIWNPSTSPGVVNANVFGAGVWVYGTIVTSGIGLIIAFPLGVAIGVFLALLAPGRAGAVIGPLVELLAAIPSVVIGLWGIIVLAPFMRSVVEPVFHDVLGFIPIFGAPSTTGLGIMTAGFVLALMALPIIASISRDIFLSVPRELKDGALALGATRWEMIRGVVLDSTRSGLMAAGILGLSRALGEAIAVTQVIGAGTSLPGGVFGNSFFNNGDTLASKIAEVFPGTNHLFTASLFYLAVILLVIELIVNLTAQLIVYRFERRQGLVR
ncbi:MAG TPA: phosphate ABC transporter permease subunit PstC [Solirubrobacteraceae bacterium]|jgi:phosphate transport system permease protein|nr:phosphate ABC transporter permease subunit PstC [Solirubrobacteraceae bacterium]